MIVRFFKQGLLVVVLSLVLVGCGSSSNYSAKLSLPAIEPPATLAPVGSMMSMMWFPTVTTLERAEKASDLDIPLAMVEKYRASTPQLLGAFPGSDKAAYEKNLNGLLASVEQAAQIKKAELADGDTADASGEVAQRIQMAKQFDANVTFLAK